MDWMMPEIDGPRLCRLLREKKTDGYIYMILITTKDTKTDIISGLKSGVDDYLPKPIHPGELIARVYSGIRVLKLEASLKEAQENIRRLSITDPLTGCFNRGYLKERLPEEIRLAKESGFPLSLIMTDIDHFKRVNDTHGHQAGDEILKMFSANILRQLRKKLDWAVRYGGEEFLIILPRANIDGAFTMAERLREIIENTVTQTGGHATKITASFGGTCAMEIPDTPDDDFIEKMIQAADQNLYDSKKNGRNQVRMADLKSMK
jgi:two-component system, cell cycle response regulator